jgi:hypothetical protein
MYCSTRARLLAYTYLLCATAWPPGVSAQDSGELGDLGQFAPRQVNTGPGVGAGLMGGGALGKALGGALNAGRASAPPPAPATGAINSYRRRTATGTMSTGTFSRTGASLSKRPANKSTFVIDAPDSRSQIQHATLDSTKSLPETVSSDPSQTAVDASDMRFDGPRRLK